MAASSSNYIPTLTRRTRRSIPVVLSYKDPSESEDSDSNSKKNEKLRHKEKKTKKSVDETSEKSDDSEGSSSDTIPNKKQKLSRSSKAGAKKYIHETGDDGGEKLDVTPSKKSKTVLAVNGIGQDHKNSSSNKKSDDFDENDDDDEALTDGNSPNKKLKSTTKPNCRNSNGNSNDKKVQKSGYEVSSDTTDEADDSDFIPAQSKRRSYATKVKTTASRTTLESPKEVVTKVVQRPRSLDSSDEKNKKKPKRKRIRVGLHDSMKVHVNKHFSVRKDGTFQCLRCPEVRTKRTGIVSHCKTCYTQQERQELRTNRQVVTAKVGEQYHRISKKRYRCNSCPMEKDSAKKMFYHSIGCHTNKDLLERQREVQRQKYIKRRKICRKSYNIKPRPTLKTALNLRKTRNNDNKLKAEGGKPMFKCPFPNCVDSFYTSNKLKFHVRSKHLKSNRLGIQNFFRSIPKFPLVSKMNESKVLPYLPALALVLDDSVFCTYFVVVADRIAAHIGLIEFIRRNQLNPLCTIGKYIGKATNSHGNHDIARDHGHRGNRSSLFESIRSGEKVAFEIRRHYHSNADDQTKEEAFWQLEGALASHHRKSTENLQWDMINIRLETSNMNRQLTIEDQTLASGLASTNHPMICADKDCRIVHNADGHAFYGLWHIEPDAIKLLDFDQYL